MAKSQKPMSQKNVLSVKGPAGLGPRAKKAQKIILSYEDPFMGGNIYH